jgi:hypothetical protein
MAEFNCRVLKSLFICGDVGNDPCDCRRNDAEKPS